MAGSLCLLGLHAAMPWLAIGLACCTVAPSLADTIDWTDPNRGEPNDPNHRTNTTGVDLAPPNADDTALFIQAGTYTVTFSADPLAIQFQQTVADRAFINTDTIEILLLNTALVIELFISGRVEERTNSLLLVGSTINSRAGISRIIAPFVPIYQCREVTYTTVRSARTIAAAGTCRNATLPVQRSTP